MKQNAAAAADALGGAVSAADREYLRRVREQPPPALDGAFVREFADRLARYPGEVAAFVGVFAVLLQRNRELAADNEQLVAAIMQLRSAVLQPQPQSPH